MDIYTSFETRNNTHTLHWICRKTIIYDLEFAAYCLQCSCSSKILYASQWMHIMMIMENVLLCFLFHLRPNMSEYGELCYCFSYVCFHSWAHIGPSIFGFVTRCHFSRNLSYSYMYFISGLCLNMWKVLFGHFAFHEISIWHIEAVI